MAATLHPPGGGKGYEWSLDHTFVKVGAGETGGAYTLMEDNLKPGFRLALHLHRSHAETFYILDGAMWFHVNGAWHLAERGACLLPPGTPHEVELPEGGTARMLMIYQPAGFDAMLAEMAGMTAAQFADPAVMAADAAAAMIGARGLAMAAVLILGLVWRDARVLLAGVTMAVLREGQDVWITFSRPGLPMPVPLMAVFAVILLAELACILARARAGRRA